VDWEFFAGWAASGLITALIALWKGHPVLPAFLWGILFGWLAIIYYLIAPHWNWRSNKSLRDRNIRYR
jgi:hypothetical protein